MKSTRTFADDLFDISIVLLFAIALFLLAVSANINPANADETEGPFVPRALVCMVVGPTQGCNQYAAKPTDTLAECFKTGEDFHARMRSGEALSPELRNGPQAVVLKWATGCLRLSTGEMMVTVEDEGTFGGKT